jgi:formylglycine-generating enzyme required for sulfatase activity
MTLREWLAMSGFRAAAALAFCLLPMIAHADEPACIAATGQESPATGAGSPGSTCPEEITPPQVFRDCDVCPEMIALPMGEFMMGAPDDEFRRNVTIDRAGGRVVTTPESPFVVPEEGPQVRVVVDIPIAMGRNEITYDDWLACMNDGGCGGYLPDDGATSAGSMQAIKRSLTDPSLSHTASEAEIARAVAEEDYVRVSGRYPVIWVSYLDAMAYIQWLNTKLGMDAYRLPTEAEWEYAARASTTTRFAQGFEVTADQANFNGESTELYLAEVRPDLRTRGYPVPVDELDAANAWGLRHMSGNVSEITSSCFSMRLGGWRTSSEWLKKSPAASCKRSARGGSYGSPMDKVRVAQRLPRDEAHRGSSSGFRVVKELN